MCTASMIMDFWEEDWGRRYGSPFHPMVPTPSPFLPEPIDVTPMMPFPPYDPTDPVAIPAQPVLPTAEELDFLRRLMIKAREYDEKNNEPDCEMEDKKRRLQEMADRLGVKIDFLD